MIKFNDKKVILYIFLIATLILINPKTRLYAKEVPMNIKLEANLCIDKSKITTEVIEPDELGKLIIEDLVEAWKDENIKLTTEIKIINKEDFLKFIKETNKNLPQNVKTFDYLLLINVYLTGDKPNHISITGTLFNTISEKPYTTLNISKSRALGEKLDVFILNGLTDLESALYPVTGLIEGKEIPVSGTIVMEKNNVLLTSSQKIKGKISNLLNKDGEDIRDYIGGNTKIAIRLADPSYGVIDFTDKGKWNILSIDDTGEINFSYSPPPPGKLSQIITKEVIEIAPILQNNIIENKILDKSIINLQKPVVIGEPTATPLPTESQKIKISKKDLMVNINIIHYSSICPRGQSIEEGNDYAEVIALVKNKPVKELVMEIYSFKPSEKPPKDITKLKDGVIMYEKDKGYYCAGSVPVMGKFKPVNFYEGGKVLLKISYHGKILGTKYFTIPSFVIKNPVKGKLYLSGVKLKAEITPHGKKSTAYNWYNYKITKDMKRMGIKIIPDKDKKTSATFTPSTLDGIETENILRVESQESGSSDIKSPDGYWGYTISAIKEISYRVKPSHKDMFSKWKLLKENNDISPSVLYKILPLKK